jgi:hypothetical protein
MHPGSMPLFRFSKANTHTKALISPAKPARAFLSGFYDRQEVKYCEKYNKI